MTATGVQQKPISIEDHPLVDDVNRKHNEKLTPVERACKTIADATGAPVALFAAILLQLGWVAVGSVTRWDPYPFAFLLTISNILQLILIFIIAVAQRQQSEHAELRAESDHDSISRLLYHQQLQNELLLRIAERSGIEVDGLRAMAHQLSTEG